MSYEIEFDRKVFTFTGYNEWGETGKEKLLLVNKRGSSNITDSDGNIVKEWGYTTIGSERDVIGEIASFARDVEGGMLRYQNGRTRIENYIKNWRKEDRIPIDEFNKHFRSGEMIVYHPTSDEELKGYQKDVLNDIKNSWRRTNKDVSGRRVIKYAADVTSDSVKKADAISDSTSISMNLNCRKASGTWLNDV